MKKILAGKRILLRAYLIDKRLAKENINAKRVNVLGRLFSGVV